jgi:hypothetical protein
MGFYLCDTHNNWSGYSAKTNIAAIRTSRKSKCDESRILRPQWTIVSYNPIAGFLASPEESSSNYYTLLSHTSV